MAKLKDVALSGDNSLDEETPKLDTSKFKEYRYKGIGKTKNYRWAMFNYSPISMIDFCTNKISHFEYLISDGDFNPLLIGKNYRQGSENFEIIYTEEKKPLIWLFSKDKKGVPIDLIIENKSYHKDFEINIDDDRKVITVYKLSDRTLILRIKYQDTPIITNLDLRKIGYNIFGDITGLNVGGSTYIGNIFQGAKSFISVGD